MTNPDHNPETEKNEPVSKSQRKRDMHELQLLGEELSKLSVAQLNKMGLPERLLDALLQSQLIHSHGAHKRQLHYIGKVMRDVEIQPIQEELAKIKNISASAARKFHALEKWRDRLIDEDDRAISSFIEQYPAIDKQQLRQLIRNAKKEKQSQKPPLSTRKLFQLLKQTLDETS